jgi:hypothetical protein
MIWHHGSAPKVAGALGRVASWRRSRMAHRGAGASGGASAGLSYASCRGARPRRVPSGPPPTRGSPVPGNSGVGASCGHGSLCGAFGAPRILPARSSGITGAARRQRRRRASPALPALLEAHVHTTSILACRQFSRGTGCRSIRRARPSW